MAGHDRPGERADELLPEEAAAGTADPEAQARQILDESDERQEDRDRAPGTVVEHRPSDTTVAPPD
jgi:hypothetical protein